MMPSGEHRRTGRADTATVVTAYLLAFFAALAAGIGLVNLLSPAFVTGSAPDGNVRDILVLVMIGLAVLAVFQLIFGLITGIGRGLAYWLVAPAITVATAGIGWLMALSPLGKGAEIQDVSGFGQALVDAFQRAFVLMIGWGGSLFFIGLAMALIARRRLSGARLLQGEG